MPKVTLQFNLPAEAYEYKVSCKANDLMSLIHEFTREIRSKTKHGDGKPVGWEDVSTMWWQLLNDYSIDSYGD